MPIPPAAARHAPPASASEVPCDRVADRAYVAPMARAILAHALLVGVAADLLLRRGVTGLGFPLWLSILTLSAVSLVQRNGRGVGGESAAWLGLAVLWGAAMAWRGSGSLQGLDFIAALFALGMAAVSLADENAALFARRIRDTIWAGARVVRSVAFGALLLTLHDVALPMARRQTPARVAPGIRAALIALPLLLVFGALLRGADPVFASLVTLPEIDLETAMSHVAFIGFFGWVVAGWARSALLAGPPGARLPEQLPFALTPLDLTVTLGALNILFAAFVATQIGVFFGGERFLQAQTGLTAAQYARQGFFQMIWVALLVVPLLLGTRAALRPERDMERRHSALALPLIALLGVMIVSALLRMRLYVRYYGLTLDRFYPLVFMAWLALVLVWLALTVLRGRGRPFAAGAVASGLALLLVLNAVVPDVIVARVDTRRAAAPGADGPRTLDLEHLASLGAEAVPLAVNAVLSARPSVPSAGAAASPELDRCKAANRLLRRWGGMDRRRDVGDDGWRPWNRGEALAARVVGANAPALRAVAHDACGRVRATAAAQTGRPTTVPAGR